MRVLSSDRHLLLRRVPPAAASCLEIGSTSPGALLYDARRLFDAQDARATGGWVQGHCDVGMSSGRGLAVGAGSEPRRRSLSRQFDGVWTSAKRRTISRSPSSGSLPSCSTVHLVSCARCAICHAGELLDLVRSGELSGAADDCLAAAAAELDPLKQAALLKASCYGRAFRQLEPPAAAQKQQVDAVSSGSGVSGDPRRQVVEMARRLRVLNALRDPGALLSWHAWSGWSRRAGG